jgi:glucose-6-phosphate isomerase
MHYSQSVDGCLSSRIGDYGLEPERLGQWLTLLTPGFKTLGEKAAAGTFPHFRVLDRDDEIEEARAAFDKLSEGADTIVLLGTGGSSLGGQALAQLGGWSIPGDNGPKSQAMPRLRFYDNLDSRSFLRGLSILDLEKTRFIVISKSGTTAETLIQTLTVFTMLDEAGLSHAVPNLFLGVTEPTKPGVSNGLRALFQARNVPVLPHDTQIGGRFSVFTNVGLLPALARGLDVAAFRKGAKTVVDNLVACDMPEGCAPAVGAACAVGLARDLGVTNSVMMPYSDRLERFSAWYVQLWAESLGKSGNGTTPVAALGPVDQHSQLQLYMDGPRTHLVNLLRVTEAAPQDEKAVPAQLAQEAGAPYLAGRTIGDLVRAQQRAVADALADVKRPVRTFDIPKLDEAALGALMMHFMIETILAADLLDVDPYDQPAVELGKVLTRRYLAQ